MNGCDTLLMVGSGFPYSEFLPPEGQARGVQIDIDGRMLGLRYPMEVGLVGDSAATEQRAMEGDPTFSAAQDVPDFPYADYGRLLGLVGIRVPEPALIGQAWDEALAADRPVVLEMVTDPDMPPLPPHITLQQTRAYLSALLHGDPDSVGVVIASVKETWDSLFPPVRGIG